jgi:hypothetical protein
MKLFASLLAGLSCCLGHQALAAPQPRGSVLELHSCELYAGGCIVSSEATLDGRYMLRAWNFSDGSFNRTTLAGLNLAVLQASGDNLASPEARAGSVIVYLPQAATAPQRQALLAWLKASQPDICASTKLQTRIVPIQFSKTDTGYELSAGDFVSVKTAPLESCRTGACGEALWYSPRAHTSVFTVAMDRASTVAEPLLQLKWNDAGRRTVFLGKFGQETPARDLFVSSAELCGPAEKLF